MNNWKLFHAYRHLAEEGKVKSLRCPDCDTVLVTWLNRDDTDNPRLWCCGCDKTIVPGLTVIDQIRAVVKEHTKD